MSQDPRTEAAAMHGLATNPALSPVDRLGCALQAMCLYEHLLAALAEDEPAMPRVWAMPEIPADVTAVLDRDDIVIRRNREGRWIHEGPGLLAGVKIGWTDMDLIRLRGPVTEVMDGSATWTAAELEQAKTAGRNQAAALKELAE